jgi:hypothetical protein
MTRSQLQRLLASAGLSQRGATRAIGISDRTMRKYIRDDLPIPRVVEYALYFVIREIEAGPHGGITGQFDRAGAEIDNDKREGGWRLRMAQGAKGFSEQAVSSLPRRVSRSSALLTVPSEDSRSVAQQEHQASGTIPGHPRSARWNPRLGRTTEASPYGVSS